MDKEYHNLNWMSINLSKFFLLLFIDYNFFFNLIFTICLHFNFKFFPLILNFEREKRHLLQISKKGNEQEGRKKYLKGCQECLQRMPCCLQVPCWVKSIHQTLSEFKKVCIPLIAVEYIFSSIYPLPIEDNPS